MSRVTPVFKKGLMSLFRYSTKSRCNTTRYEVTQQNHYNMQTTVWMRLLIGAQTKGLTYSPTNVGIEQEYWQSLSYLPSTAQAGSDKIKARI